MSRILKIIGIICLVLVLVLFGVIGYIISTVDLKQIKQQISENVKKETGRELLIKGDLDLSFFPWLGVEVGETHFSNAAGFSGDFASFSRAQASLKLMPLFSKQVEMSTLIFDDFTLNLQKRKDGVSNWDDLAKAGEDEAAGKAAPAEAPGAAGGLALLLEGVDIRNANVSFQDEQAGSSIALNNFNFSAGQVGLQQDVPFTINFQINLSDPQISGDYLIKGIANADPSAGLFKVRDLSFEADLNASGLPAETIALDFTANLAFDQKRMRLDVTPFNLQTSLKGEGIPNQSADLTIDSALVFDVNAMTANLKPLTIGIPGGTIQGDFAYAQKGQQQQLDFDLSADQIDINRFVAPGPETAAAKPAGTPAAAKSAAAEPAGKPAAAKDNSGLRNLLVNGDLKIGKLIKDSLLVSDIAMHIKMRDAILDISPLTAKLYQGLANNNINVDLRGPAPKVKAKLNIKGFQVGDYLQAAMEKDVIEGTADVDADLRLTAADAATIKRSLNGSAAFKVGKGALKGVNIPDLIRRAKATLSGQSPPPASDQTTDFSELSGTAKIVDGLVNNHDLTMKSPLLRIGGDGSVNLPQEQVNYLVTAKLVASLTGQGGDDLKDLVGVPIPIRITGSFTEPDWQLDLKSVLEEKVKSQAKGVVDKALKDPQEALKDPKKLLEGLKF